MKKMYKAVKRPSIWSFFQLAIWKRIIKRMA
jgi:hypothetical protein